MSIETNPIFFNTGEMLTGYCIKNRIYKAALARKMKFTYQALFYYLKADSMDIQKLVEFSHVLKHNFVMDIAVQLLPNTKPTQPPTPPKTNVLPPWNKKLHY
jgi:hypothetical protein